MPGRADSGDIEIDLVELLSDVGGLAADAGRGIAVFVDEMQDLGPDDVSALCAACHELSQTGLPLVVVGAGLPHLPAVLSASKSYSERLFRYQRIDRLDRAAADRALEAPAKDEDAEFTTEALDALYAATAGYPYFVQAYGKVAWDVAPRSPITADDVRVAAPEAEAELAVGFFGSRYERATPAEREYLRAMADLAASVEDGEADPHAGVPTSAIAEHLGRKAQSLSPARDALDQEGPGLQRRARPDRLHRAALRPLPAPARRGVTSGATAGRRGSSPSPSSAGCSGRSSTVDRARGAVGSQRSSMPRPPAARDRRYRVTRAWRRSAGPTRTCSTAEESRRSCTR